MIKNGWFLIRVQRKPKFKIGNLKNTENLTSHHITYIKRSSSPGDRAGKQTQLIKAKARLYMRVTIGFFSKHHTEAPTLF